MPTDENWLKVHKFLVERFLSQEPFTKGDLVAVTNWKGQSPHTYWSKQIKPLLLPVGAKKFRVGEAFYKEIPSEWFLVPPAYEKVWICTKPNGHLQATGVDARGRKQYRYHPKFREVREEAKEQQGNPHVKMRIRRIQRDLARRQMIAWYVSGANESTAQRTASANSASSTACPAAAKAAQICSSISCSRATSVSSGPPTSNRTPWIGICQPCVTPKKYYTL